MGQEGWWAGAKHAGGAYVRQSLGTNMAQTRNVLGQGFKQGKFFSTVGKWLNAAEGTVDVGGIARIKREASAHWRGGGVGGYLGGKSVARRGLSLNRYGAVGGAALGVGMGISAATGYSMGDQAQGVAGGYMAGKALSRVGAFGGGGWGKAAGVAGVAGGAFVGQALGWESWALGGVAAGAVRGAQFASGRWLGGGYTRAGAAAIGAGVGWFM